jgi:hypothetical protein
MIDFRTESSWVLPQTDNKESENRIKIFTGVFHLPHLGLNVFKYKIFQTYYLFSYSKEYLKMRDNFFMKLHRYILYHFFSYLDYSIDLKS